MNTLDLGGVIYEVGKMNAINQLHVGRRLLPALVAVGIRAEDLQGKEGVSMVDFMEPAMKLIGTMRDEDVNYVLYRCLAVVKRKQGDRFAPVTAGERLMFEDIDMPTMVRLVGAVLQENLGGFFVLLPGVKLSPESSATPGAASS